MTALNDARIGRNVSNMALYCSYLVLVLDFLLLNWIVTVLTFSERNLLTPFIKDIAFAAVIDSAPFIETIYICLLLDGGICLNAGVSFIHVSNIGIFHASSSVILTPIGKISHCHFNFIWMDFLILECFWCDLKLMNLPFDRGSPIIPFVYIPSNKAPMDPSLILKWCARIILYGWSCDQTRNAPVLFPLPTKTPAFEVDINLFFWATGLLNRF